MNNYYAGIGSRKTPEHILILMYQLAQKIASRGYILRSGNADGADKNFEAGCDKASGSMEIFLSICWYTKNFGITEDYDYQKDIWSQATEIARTHHPTWDKLTLLAKRLHTRNTFQVLGADLKTPSKFVLCWTPDGAKTKDDTSKSTGGTGQAIRIADTYGVKVYNFANQDDYAIAQKWLEPDKNQLAT